MAFVYRSFYTQIYSTSKDEKTFVYYKMKRQFSQYQHRKNTRYTSDLWDYRPRVPGVGARFFHPPGSSADRLGIGMVTKRLTIEHLGFVIFKPQADRAGRRSRLATGSAAEPADGAVIFKIKALRIGCS